MIKIKIYSISISICAVFVSVLINSSYAQTMDNFEPYTNKEMKFSIQYPSNWEVEEHEQDDLIPAYTTFRERDSPKGGFTVVTEKIEPYLDTDTMTLKNTSIKQRVQQELNDWLSSKETKIIRQNWVTVGGNSGYKIEHSWSCEHCRPDEIGYGF